MTKQALQSSFLAASLVFAPALLSAQTARMQATPGVVNYTEGLVSINNSPLHGRTDPAPVLRPNDTLATTDGKAEILLSPGAFLRVGRDSEIRMIAPELVDPRVEILRGEAMLEVDQKLKDAHLDVLQRGAEASILKQGLYRFNFDQNQIQVIDGKLRVSVNGQSKELGKGKEVALNDPKLKPQDFDRKAEDDLYAWSNIRSGYMAEANASTARYSYGAGPGWYWNPWFSSYAWLPGNGFFYSPFGYPFYSPGSFGYSTGYFGGWRGGPAFHGGGFRGGGFRGGGFHGGGGRGGGIGRSPGASGFAGRGIAGHSGGAHGGPRGR